MIVIKELKRESENTQQLESYLSHNFREVYDFFICQSHPQLIEAREEIDNYLLIHRQQILALPTDRQTAPAFQALLLEVAERLGLLAAFRYLYTHLSQRAPEFISERVEAASRYLIKVKSIDDLFDRFDSIYELLNEAFHAGTDKTDQIIATFINLYSKVVEDYGQFNLESVKKFKQKIEDTLAKDEFSFLNSPLILEVLQLDVDDHSVLGQEIQTKLDVYLGRGISVPTFKTVHLTEDDTEYCDALQSIEVRFSAIKRISVSEYSANGSNEVFYSLKRGTSVLERPIQLAGYLYSYGDNHYAKLQSAFPFIPKVFLQGEVSVIDWACGQALASMALFDYLTINNLKVNIRNVQLIEPSEIALRRAALHISKYRITDQVYTIHRDFDSLTVDDLKNYSDVVKIHLLSNILDMDFYSLSKMLTLIEEKFSGPNLFVCLSPHVGRLQLTRINSFVDFFRTKKKFAVHGYEDNPTWGNGWSRVLRVFSVVL